PHMNRLTAFLGTTPTEATARELRRQKVPRRRVAEGLDLAVYRWNGWEPPQGSEADELRKRREFAAAEATPAAMETLDRLCREYEAAYWSPAPRAAAPAPIHP
ncbi:MAG: Uncharacterized protein FD126_3602, partial [Elusimicrobia bacterium]